MVHEIEIRSVLSKEKYEGLKKILPKKYKKVNEDTITTVKFMPNDVRVRYSDKINELVLKEKDPTLMSRKEISINLKSRKDCMAMIKILDSLGLEQHPSWITERQDFSCTVDGFDYTLSLQHTKNFAYLIEAEIMCDEKDDEKHISVLKKILKDFGCEPMEPEDLKARIKEYVDKNKKK